MNTPTHAILNAALLARGGRRGRLTPVVLGAVLPDVAMFVLFVVATFVWRQPQAETWGVTYFRPGWQHAVDALHSFPLLGALFAATYLPVAMPRVRGPAPDQAEGFGDPRARASQRRRAVRDGIRLMVASALLHAGADFLVHAEDAHHHLWPLSDWRFSSPVSYWDPRHYGLVFVPLECLGALALLPVVWRATANRAGRMALAGLALVYAAGAVASTVRLLAGRGSGTPGSLQGVVTGRP